MDKPSAREIDVKRKPLKFGNSDNAKVLRQHVKNNEQKKARSNTINNRRGLHVKDAENANGSSGVKAFTLGAKPAALGTNTNLVNIQAVSKPRTKEELLAKLKLYKEQKRVIEAQRRAEKKPVFVVPTHTIVRPEEEHHRHVVTRVAAVKEANESKRVTRSQTQKAKAPGTAPVKTAHDLPAKPKPQPKPGKAVKPTTVPDIAKPAPRKSFVPEDFQFKAPLALKNYSHLFNTANEAKLSAAIKNLSFASPKPASPQEIPQISPPIYIHPNITRTRGSSSKRKQAKAAEERLLEANKAQLSSPTVKPAESSSVAQETERSLSPLRKLVYSPVPGVPTSVPNEEVAPASSSGCKDVKFFRDLLVTEKARLTTCCVDWTQVLDTADPPPPDHVCDTIRCVVGQAQLLQKERFVQFAGLVDNCEHNTGEKPVHVSDLEGFWDMVYYQVMDVDRKFADLEKLKANNWQEPETVVVKKKAAKKPAKKPTLVVRPVVAKSSLRELMLAKRRELAAVAKSPRASPNSTTTPSRTSVRRSAILNSAKKSEQMTEREQGGQTPRSNRRRSSRKILLTPKTNEEMEDVAVTPTTRKAKKTPRKSITKSKEDAMPSPANDVMFATGAQLDPVLDSEEKEESESSDNGSVRSKEDFVVPTVHIDAPSAVPVAEIPIPEVHHTYSRKHPDVHVNSPDKLRNAVFDALLESPRHTTLLSPRYFEPDSEISDDEPELEAMETDVVLNEAEVNDAADQTDESTTVPCQPRRSVRVSVARSFTTHLSSIPEVERASVSSPQEQYLAKDFSKPRRSQRHRSLLYSPHSPSTLAAKSNQAISPNEDLIQF